jgi:hypothetical protein
MGVPIVEQNIIRPKITRSLEYPKTVTEDDYVVLDIVCEQKVMFIRAESIVA